VKQEADGPRIRRDEAERERRMSQQVPDCREIDLRVPVDSAECVFCDGRLEFFFRRGDELVSRVMSAKDARPAFFSR
jgi:hypothetical protein